VPLAVAEHHEATALGAAALAMLARGTLSVDELKATTARRQRVEPGPPPSVNEREAWRRALADALARPA
jgi:sugar (pentulose or hexulose) kinase